MRALEISLVKDSSSEREKDGNAQRNIMYVFWKPIERSTAKLSSTYIGTLTTDGTLEE